MSKQHSQKLMFSTTTVRHEYNTAPKGPAHSSDNHPTDPLTQCSVLHGMGQEKLHSWELSFTGCWLTSWGEDPNVLGRNTVLLLWKPPSHLPLSFQHSCGQHLPYGKHIQWMHQDFPCYSVENAVENTYNVVLSLSDDLWVIHIFSKLCKLEILLRWFRL